MKSTNVTKTKKNCNSRKTVTKTHNFNKKRTVKKRASKKLRKKKTREKKSLVSLKDVFNAPALLWSNCQPFGVKKDYFFALYCNRFKTLPAVKLSTEELFFYCEG